MLRIRERAVWNRRQTAPATYGWSESGQLLLDKAEDLSNAKTDFDYVYLDSFPVGIVTWTFKPPTSHPSRPALTISESFYVETDQLGTPRAVISPDPVTTNDIVVWNWDYFASNSSFGENAPDEDPMGSGTPFSLNLRFPGQYFDAETGLSYNYRRDYEAGTGRYIESDPVGLYGAISTYAYAGSSPLVLVDPKGLKAKGARPIITCGLWEWLFKKGAKSAGGAAAEHAFCPDGKEDCEGRCNCKYKIRNVKCLDNPACLQRSYGVLLDCLFDCAGGYYKPNPNDEDAGANG